MTKTTNAELPLLLKFSLVIIGLIGLFYILIVGRGIIIPLIFGLLFAILLNPVVNFLTRFNVNRILAIFIVLLVAMAALAGFVYLFSSQLTMFQESFPEIKQKLTELYENTVTSVSEKFNIPEKRMTSWIASSKENMMGNSGTLIGQTFLSIGGVLAFFLLMPVYIFMFLFYKTLLLDFIARLFDSTRNSTIVEVLSETKILIQKYLVGLMVEAAIVAALDITALLVLGVQYAFLLGLMAAVLNLIPYIGGIIAISFPIMIVLVTKPPIYILWVFLAYMTVQFNDNHVIIPKVVGSRVKVNALAAIIAVLIGGAVWGVPGMFLSLPLTAIIKVIFDRVEALQAWGFLLGDTMPTNGGSLFNKLRKKKTTTVKT